MSITTIAPAILSTNPTEYKQIVQEYFPFAKRVHIDVSDGTLTKNLTIPESGIWWPRGWTVDIHMMSAKPSAHLDMLIRLHPNLVLFHAEASEDLMPIIDAVKQAGMKAGIVIVKNVYPGSIKTILNAVDHALIFSGDLGKQGGEADFMQLEKVSLIQQIHPGIEIGWDGGANIDNVRFITHGGVDVINVGSGLAKAPNKQEMYEQLLKETENEAPI